MSWIARAQAGLDRLGTAGLRRALRVRGMREGDRVPVAGHRPILDFASNDYLALSTHPAVVEAAARAARDWGAGAAASRAICGTLELHERLEGELAEFKGCESALVFPSGYMASLALITSLAQPGDVVFVDRLAHACLVDGARLSGATLRVFPHGDTARLERLLDRAVTAPHRWIVVDGVYSMDGDVAPLPRLLELARQFRATVILDDAHGTGTVGATGRGTPEHHGVRPADHPEHLLLIATLSKALGAQGGVVLGPAVLREWLLSRARTHLFTTALAPAAAAAALEAITLLRTEPAMVSELARKSALLRDELGRGGCDTRPSSTMIVPVPMGSAAACLEASKQAAGEGIWAAAIRPPTVPRGTSRLRLSVSLRHDDAILLATARTVAEIARRVALESHAEDADEASD